MSRNEHTPPPPGDPAPEADLSQAGKPQADLAQSGQVHADNSHADKAHADKEKSRRKREVSLAVGGALLIVGLTWVELRMLGLNSALFLGLFNLNVILLLVMLFVVARNGVKLLLERRRNVLGSRLRTRLVAAFIFLSLVPVALMYYVSAKFVQTSVDYWFKAQVEESMEQSLEIGRAFYQSAQARLEKQGKGILEDVAKNHYVWGGKAMDSYMAEKQAEYGLWAIGIIGPDGKDRNKHPEAVFDRAWGEIRGKIDLADLRKTPRYYSTMLSTAGSDLVVGVLPVDEGRSGFLIVAESIGGGLMYKLDEVARGIGEYKKLRKLKYPWKMTLYLTLGVMSLIIVLAATWFGFRLAKELSAPVQALADGTDRIAKGDLSVRLEDTSGDELGSLVRSFNRMAEDLQAARTRLMSANDRLGQQYEELERRGRYIEAVLDNITSGVISTDALGRIGTVNKAAEAMLGVSAGQLIGLKAQHLVSGEFSELLKDALVQIARNPRLQWTRQIELPLSGRNARFLVNVVGLAAGISPPVGPSAPTGPGPLGEGMGLVAVFEDITELEKMQRLAAWREVAQRIAHEIKNPLTPIKLSAQRLLRKFSAKTDDPSFTECGELIVREVERLQQMVGEFSNYAKLPEIQPRLDDLNTLLAEVAGTFEVSHRHIAWALELPEAIGPFAFDREGLRKVLINLLTNAAEALEGRDDGRVTLAAQVDRRAGRVRISVEDNGPGIPAAERARMFEPYFSRKKSGTGLGLTIVRSIVADHRGHVRVETAKPHGAVFIVDLPLA